MFETTSYSLMKKLYKLEHCQWSYLFVSLSIQVYILEMKFYRNCSICFLILKNTGVKRPVPPRLDRRDLVMFPRWHEYSLGNSEGPGHFQRDRENQPVLMQGLDQRIPPNETRRNLAFNACEEHEKEITYLQTNIIKQHSYQCSFLPFIKHQTIHYDFTTSIQKLNMHSRIFSQFTNNRCI